jgi:hypothetical protein
MSRCAGFIRNNYLRTKRCDYVPEVKHIKPYFEGHAYKSFISSYMEPQLSRDDKMNSMLTDEIAGLMTTRPVYMVHNKRKRPVYYVDYLCVRRSKRRQDVAPTVIQTHHYHQRREEPRIHVSMFKREGVLTNIVPLCAYLTRTFTVSPLLRDWRRPNFSAYRITPMSNNMEIVDRLVHKCCRRLSYVIAAHIVNLQRLVQTGNICIYCLHYGGEPVGLFFYRDQKCIYEGGTTTSLFASIASSNIVENGDGWDAMAWGAMESLKMLVEKKGFRYICIEDIGDTARWLDFAVGEKGARDACAPSPTAYYMYNFGIRPVDAKDVVVVL